MDINLLLEATRLRIAGDTDTGEQDLGQLLTTIKAIKGARRPDSMANPCITINAPSAPQDEDYKTINGTLIINVFADNHNSGNANIELLTPVAARIEYLFDDKPLTIEGYNNYNLVVQETMGPLWDSDDPDEHFMNTRIKFNLKPVN
ncbi:hypothetical protein [Halocella sp. SP3-1]|uniref:hypothetical protein n=1 Tax=Halocella sp. SP3-1 TaxID=2382161 RepID=UPI000F74CAE6|nr:hypothetical protein [Halocella sp. SP3-1]AZO96134.1 hypothetical protein D7D81_16910 [Halocella sp. SP3-1]